MLDHFSKAPRDARQVFRCAHKCNLTFPIKNTIQKCDNPNPSSPRSQDLPSPPNRACSRPRHRTRVHTHSRANTPLRTKSQIYSCHNRFALGKPGTHVANLLGPFFREWQAYLPRWVYVLPHDLWKTCIFNKILMGCGMSYVPLTNRAPAEKVKRV